MEIKTTDKIYDELCDNTGCGYHQESDTQWVRVNDILSWNENIDKLKARLNLDAVYTK